MPLQYVIIGSGIAGLSAAEVIRKKDPSATIRMVSEERHPFYSRPGLAYFLRRDIPEKQLYLRTLEDQKSLNLIRYHACVQSVDTNNHLLHFAEAQPLPYDRLLFATGALATPPSFPGSTLSGVTKLDGLDDTNAIITMAKKANSAVVIGGGITALELAEGLNARHVKVHYFLRGERYWSDVLDEAESKIVMDRLKHEGIKIHTKTQVKEVVGLKGKVTGVITQDDERFDAQLIAVAIGVKPRIDLAVKSGLTTRKGIIVNPYLETSAPDVFAAGDCAEIVDPVSGLSQQDVLWPIAIAQGRVAGANMIGEQVAYQKEISFNVTMLAGLKVAIIGNIGGGERNKDLVAITRGESESWRFLPRSMLVESENQINRLRIALGEKTIIGALVMGDQSLTRPLKHLILEQADISSIRATLEMQENVRAVVEQFYRSWSSSR